ncbi:MAG: hypothetical protein HC915_11535, partial [Anaerolineae bacterium]|nr:hypothetical protein [Anaerolineae bacterium]
MEEDEEQDLAELINQQDEDGNTPMHLAVQAQNQDLVKQLFEAGADPTVANKDGKSAIALAE